MLKQTKTYYEPKCKTCDMPKSIQAENASIKDNCGFCSICFMAKERDQDDKENR